MLGSLYVVATPIGNRGDISQRARQILAEVDLIAAEDTRHTQRLLTYYQITCPSISLHEHNETQKVPQLIKKLSSGLNLALVSDAGCPLISDPGYKLVASCQAAGIRVIPIPGASAITTLLCAAGLPTDRFCFEGFIQAKASARQKQLQSVRFESRTLLFYEAPHRIAASLSDMRDIFGPERAAVVGRELTKKYETIYADNLAALSALFQNKSLQRGEFVLAVHGAVQETPVEISEHRALLQHLLEELPTSQASRLAAKITGANKKDFYQLAVKLSAKNE